MADASLSIIVRAKDLLTAELKRMGTSFAEVSRVGQAAFRDLEQAARVTSASLSSIGKTNNIATLEAQIAAATARLVEMRAASANAILFDPKPIEALEREILQAQEALDLMRAAGDRAGLNIKARITEAQDAINRLGRSNTSLRPLEQELEFATQRLAAMKEAATRAGGAVSALDKGNLAKLSNDVLIGEAAIKRMSAAAQPGLTNAANAAAASVRQVGTTGATAASTLGTSFAAAGATIKAALLPILPILTVTGAAFAAVRGITDFSDFSKSIAEVAAIADPALFSISALRQEVLRLAKAYGKNEVDQARGLYFAISSGAKDAAEGVKILETATRLGVAGGASTEASVDLLTSALNAYKNQNLQAAEAADVLFQTTVLGKGRIEDLALSFGRALPIGAALGISFKELNAFLAELTLTLGSTDQATTALRNLLGQLFQLKDEDRERLAKAGAPIDPASIAANGLASSIENLNRVLKGNAQAFSDIFPDIRGFVGLLSLVSDGGVDVRRVMESIEKSIGSVGEGIDRKFSDTAVRAGVVLNALRIDFEQAFGGAFFASVGRAIDSMGGFEEATKKVEGAAKTIGTAFGVLFPAILTGIQVVTVGFAGFIDLLGLTKNAIIEAGRQFSLLFFDQSDIRETIVAIQKLTEIVDKVQADSEAGVVRLLSDDEIARARKAIEGLPNEANVEIAIDTAKTQADIRGVIVDLEKSRAEIELILTEPKDRKAAINAILKDLGEQQKKLFSALNQGGNAILAGFGEEAKKSTRSIEEVAAAFEDAQAAAKLYALAVSSTSNARLSSPIKLSPEELKQAAQELRKIRDAAAAAEKEAAGLRQEYAQLVNTKIEGVQADIGALTKKLAESKEIADLLGVSIEDIDVGADTSKLKELQAQLGKLQAKLKELSAQGQIAITPNLGEFGPVIQATIEAERQAIGNLTNEIKAALARGDTITAEALFSRREQIELSVRARESVQAALGEFDGLKEAGDIIRKAFEVKVDKDSDFAGALREETFESSALVDALTEQLIAQGRTTKSASEVRRELFGIAEGERQATIAARAAEIEAKRYLITLQKFPSIVTTTIILNGVQAAIVALNELADRAPLEGTALALDIKIEGLDKNQLSKAIDEARAQLDNENLAISLGLSPKIDPKSLAQFSEESRQALETATAAIGFEDLEAQAISLGVSLDTTTLPADVAFAVFAAQRESDEITTRGEAVKLGIELIDDQDELKRQVLERTTEIKRFAAENPIAFEAINQAASGLSQAFVDFASGAKSAKEAFGQFAISFLRQIAQMILQQTLLNAIQNVVIPRGAAQAVGNAALEASAALSATTLVTAATAAGAALTLGGTSAAAAMIAGATTAAGILTAASVSGAFVAKGAVFPAARGIIYGDEPGLAHYAKGGSPYLDRVVSQPTFANASQFARSAIVPLSGGGVATPSGRHLPLVRAPGGELTVRRFARGTADVLFGEAGPEGVMRTHRAPGGGLGLRAAAGGVLPFTRVGGGRLGGRISFGRRPAIAATGRGRRTGCRRERGRRGCHQ